MNARWGKLARPANETSAGVAMGQGRRVLFTHRLGNLCHDAAGRSRWRCRAAFGRFHQPADAEPFACEAAAPPNLEYGAATVFSCGGRSRGVVGTGSRTGRRGANSCQRVMSAGRGAVVRFRPLTDLVYRDCSDRGLLPTKTAYTTAFGSCRRASVVFFRVSNDTDASQFSLNNQF